MKTIQQIAQELSQKRNDNSTKKQTVSDQQTFFNGIADLMHNMGDYVVEELKRDNKVEVINHPKPIKEIKVSNFRGIFGLLESISKTVKSFKLPDIFKVQGEVTIKNQVSIPEVKFPEPVKTVGVNVLPEYVKEYLDKISKKELKVEVKAPDVNVKVPETKVNIDLSVLEELIRTNNELLKVLDKPETAIDLSSVEEASNKTTEAIKALRFPVPNFQSSWQHSLTMQSEDRGQLLVYKTVNSKKVPDYKQFTSQDDTTYRKTYSYDTAGDCTGWTAWTKQ
jgi:hypothetical protein